MIVPTRPRVSKLTGPSTPPQVAVLHTYMLTVNELRKYRVADEELVAALTEIEDIRPAYVRGNLPGGEKAAERALHLLAVLRRKAGA